ncbi:hypothetical protein [Photobacterium sp. GB-72]|uniref:hypothetical protein n=1 Tax=Photobacterium sp. GB-72 TaxID=2022105 RepID=UPI000D150C1E|nr:hypothetical protein [Photobacterium sp. GB-72]PSV27219.1 hypothetical protein C9J40_20635 [Photobacterium sp. GB-72]
MDFEQHIKETCEHLEETVSLMGEKLTKEIGSIKLLEEVLIALINEQDEGSISGARYLIAVYLGEIILNKTGGEWYKSEINNHIAIRINNRQSFPLEAVEEFIKEPQKGKLEFFAKGLRL